MSVLGAGLLTSSLMENKIIHSLEDQKQAFYLAQAGIEYARYRLQQDLTWRTEGYTENLGEGEFTLTVSDMGEELLQIKSTGTVGQVSKTLKVGVYYTLVRGSDIIEELAQYSVLGGGNLFFKNFTRISGGGNLRSNGDITFQRNVIVDGEIIASGKVKANKIDKNQIKEGEEVYSIPDVDWDQLLENALAEGRYLLDWNSKLFQDGVVNYIDNSVTLSGKPINLNMDGILVIKGDWIVNAKIKIESVEGLMIYVDGMIKFSQNTKIDAAIYATGPIIFSKRTVLNGTIFSKEAVTCKNHTEITLDSSHLYQPIVEQIFISTDSDSDSDCSLTFTYWHES